MTESVETYIVDPVGTAPQQEQQLDINKDLETGYIVGLTAEGGFVFQVVGYNPGLSQLIGLHKHAGEKVEAIYDSKQNGAATVTLKMLQELGQMVNLLDQKVQYLMNKIEPPVDNKL